MGLEYRAFAAYHPYLTYSNPDNRDFISPSGKAETYTDANTLALFELGKNIFAVLNPLSKEEFDGGLETYYEFIEHFCSAFQKQQENGVLKLVTPTGENITVTWEELDSDQVMAIIWQVRSTNENYKQKINEDLLIHMFLYHALKLIDSSYIDVRLREGGVDFAISAANAFSNAQALIDGSDNLKIAKSELG